MESSRDIPMMEIVIPFFAVKEKKGRSTFPSPLPQENNESFVS